MEIKIKPLNSDYYNILVESFQIAACKGIKDHLVFMLHDQYNVLPGTLLSSKNFIPQHKPELNVNRAQFNFFCKKVRNNILKESQYFSIYEHTRHMAEKKVIKSGINIKLKNTYKTHKELAAQALLRGRSLGEAMNEMHQVDNNYNALVKERIYGFMFDYSPIQVRRLQKTNTKFHQGTHLFKQDCDIFKQNAMSSYYRKHLPLSNAFNLSQPIKFRQKPKKIATPLFTKPGALCVDNTFYEDVTQSVLSKYAVINFI